MVASFQTNFDPQLKIEAVKGKTFPVDDPNILKVKELPQVSVATECLEEMVIAMYRGNQQMLTLKGVQENFDDLTYISDCLYGPAKFCLKAGALEYAVVGARAAQLLGCDTFRNEYLKIYAAQREGQFDVTEMDEAFELDSLLLPACVFSVKQGVYDKGYILGPLSFARRLFHAQGEASSLELRLQPGADIASTKKEIQQIVGQDYTVHDRFDQQADTIRIMKIEKIIAYVFLTFILIVACFNIIGSLSMLMIDKKDDVQTLKKLGANDKQIQKIFLFEGWLITSLGAVIGIAIGLLLCLLQQQYGFVTMGKSDSYIVDSYPVSVHYGDVFVILLTVLAVAALAVWYSVCVPRQNKA